MKKTLIYILAILLCLGCSSRNKKPPEKPKDVPHAAKWYGGEDGGAWYIVKKSDIKNSYSVKTKGKYKGDEFWLWSYNESRNVIGLITRDSELAKKHNFLNLSDRYIKEINPKELDSIWEERSKSEYDLPLPKGIEKKKMIYQNDIS